MELNRPACVRSCKREVARARACVCACACVCGKHNTWIFVLLLLLSRDILSPYNMDMMNILLISHFAHRRILRYSLFTAFTQLKGHLKSLQDVLIFV